MENKKQTDTVNDYRLIGRPRKENRLSLSSVLFLREKMREPSAHMIVHRIVVVVAAVGRGVCRPSL